MKVRSTTTGPFAERPYYKLSEIDGICLEALKKVDLYPEQPESIRIDRFIEKRFEIHPEYEELPTDVLGLTKFDSGKAVGITITRSLDSDATVVSERRIRTTLAHEAGHILLQGHLFALETPIKTLFEEDADVSPNQIVCRKGVVDGIGGVAQANSYDGKWWEWQANRAIGALLLPKNLVIAALEDLLKERGKMGIKTLPSSKKTEATERIVHGFDVNPIVAKIRIIQIWPENETGQLEL